MNWVMSQILLCRGGWLWHFHIRANFKDSLILRLQKLIIIMEIHWKIKLDQRVVSLNHLWCVFQRRKRISIQLSQYQQQNYLNQKHQSYFWALDITRNQLYIRITVMKKIKRVYIVNARWFWIHYFWIRERNWCSWILWIFIEKWILYCWWIIFEASGEFFGPYRLF